MGNLLTLFVYPLLVAAICGAAVLAFTQPRVFFQMTRFISGVSFLILVSGSGYLLARFAIRKQAATLAPEVAADVEKLLVATEIPIEAVVVYVGISLACLILAMLARYIVLDDRRVESEPENGRSRRKR